MKTLLRLQDLDLQIEQCLTREAEIPKQKNKFDIHRARLQKELSEREAVCQALVLEQRECESSIEQKQGQVLKYEQQLNIVKKNDEYQALLHEIDLLKKQIGQHEERILSIMESLDDARAHLKEDEKRIESEVKDIDGRCAEIDSELAEAIGHREELEGQRKPLVAESDSNLLRIYTRIRASKKTGAAIVPMNDEVCGGCHMYMRAQIVNEVLAGEKIHTCQHCGRLLFHPGNFENSGARAE